jgi:hypothetical protein
MPVGRGGGAVLGVLQIILKNAILSNCDVSET